MLGRSAPSSPPRRDLLRLGPPLHRADRSRPGPRFPPDVPCQLCARRSSVERAPFRRRRPARP